MRKMDIKTLYRDSEVTLQRLVITIGECKMVKYRIVREDKSEGILDVKEVKDLPLWYLRYLKLKTLGV